MSGIFPKALSTDGVDRLNHKWMVMVVLLLSLVAFIIPLHPSYRTANSEKPAQSNSAPTSPSANPSSFDVVCWCPAQFTLAYTLYTNSYCKEAYLSALKGDNTSSVYMIMDSEIPLRHEMPSLGALVLKQMGKARQQEAQEERNTAEAKSIQARVQSLVTFQTPLMLLVIAGILVVPHVIWALLSDGCSPFNLAETLTSASQSEEISSSLGSSRAASLLYLVKKILSIVVVIALLLVVLLHAIPEIQEMEQRMDKVTPHSNVQLSKDPEIPATFLCDFEIRQLQTVQRYTVQCVKTEQKQKTAPVVSTQTRSEKSALSSEKNLLEFESCIFHTVTAVLAILVVANVLSLLGWLYKLVSTSSRNAVRLSGNAAMDTVLVVQMARINCGPHVAHRLAQSLGAPSKEG